jgi:hypothetical protein
MSIPQASINDLLLKKDQGAPWTDVNQTAALEAMGSSAPKIPFTNIMSQEIPVPAPSALVTNNTGYPYSSATSYRETPTNSAYSHIHKYTKLPLVAVVPNISFRYAGTIPGVVSSNILNQAIPFNYDPAGGYGITVFNGAVPVASNTWWFDGSSGYLTFYSAIGYTPTITFWYYGGSFGLGSGGSGSGVTGGNGSYRCYGGYRC